MRSLRLLTVVGLSIGACAFAAPAASACILDSAGAVSVSGGTVRPGDLVRITMHAVGTDDSPGASPYVITANDVEIGRGQATPDANGEWTGVISVPLDALGTYSGPVHIVVTLTDSYQQLPVPTSLAYDGRPAPAAPSAPSSDPVNSAPSGQQTPAPAAQPVSRPAGDPATGTRRRAERARPRQISRPAPRVHARPQPTSPTLRAPRASHEAPAPQVQRALGLPPVAPPAAAPSQPAARASQPVHRTKIDRAVPLAGRTISRRVAADSPATQPNMPTASASAPDRTAALAVAAALLLMLLAGGAGLAAVAIRRRNPLEPEPPDRLAEMEAELQELLAEERLRAEAATADPRTPVAP